MSLEDKNVYKNTAEFVRKKYTEHNIDKLQLTLSVRHPTANRCFVGGYRTYYEVYDNT